jgi:hypothetical protein
VAKKLKPKVFQSLGDKLIRLGTAKDGKSVIVSFVDRKDAPSPGSAKFLGLWSPAPFISPGLSSVGAVFIEGGGNLILELPDTRGRPPKMDPKALLSKYAQWRAAHPDAKDARFFRRHLGAKTDIEVRAYRSLLARAQKGTK